VTHDARLTAWSLTGPAGGTTTLRAVLPEALATATVSVWVGGSADDVDDLTGATEVEAVTDGGETTWAVPIPVGSASVPLRWTVDGVPATTGRLVPSRRGTSTADVQVPLVVGDVRLSVLLPGAGPDLLPDDSLGIIDPDAARQAFLDLWVMFDGMPDEGTEEHDELMQLLDDVEQTVPVWAPEQPTDVAAAIRNLARISRFFLVHLVMSSTNDDLNSVWTQLNELSSRISEVEMRMPRAYVQWSDPAVDGEYVPWGSIWIRSDGTPWDVLMRTHTGTDTDWAPVWPPEPPEEPTP
jgi:hypothetical protein